MKLSTDSAFNAIAEVSDAMHNKIEEMTERLRVQVASVAEHTEVLIENAEADINSLRKAEENYRNLTAFFRSCASLAKSFENEPQISALTHGISKGSERSKTTTLNQEDTSVDEMKSSDSKPEFNAKKTPEETFDGPPTKKQKKLQSFPGLWSSTN